MKKINLLTILFLIFISSACSQKPNLDNRIGFGLAEKADANYWLSELNAEWYFDWGTKEIPASSDLEYWQTIRVNQEGYSPSQETITQIQNKYPGHTWIIGNEPDNQHQDNTTPEKYAEIYHELYYLIKKNDSKAKVVIGAVSQPTPSRMDYLDKVISTYEMNYDEKMPVDWWNIHAYVLREEEDSWGAGLPVGIDSSKNRLYEIEDHGNIEIFQQNLIAFREWMKENGYQSTPLVVTEYGILLPEEFGFNQDFIASFLLEVNDWMLNYQDLSNGYSEDNFLLIQKFAWFSLSDPNFPGANLADLEQNSLTPIGKAFKEFSSKY